VKNWSLEPAGYAFRVQFEFVDGSGKLLQSKTWELRREKHDPARALLLQADAKLLSTNPEMTQSLDNFIRIKVVVRELSGNLVIKTFTCFDQPETIQSQIARYPLTLSIVLDPGGLHVSMFTASQRSAQSE
jgi:hypothetical protein